jgi:uncharacterized membrane protein YgcG
MKGLTKMERRRIGAMVDAAENVTGLQIAVWIGPADGDSRAAAEKVFVDAGLHERPGILILVAPSAQRVEVVTSTTAQVRVPDTAAAAAVEAMVAHFKAGKLLKGIDAGISRIVMAAGPGVAEEGQEELPDLLE